MLRDNVVQGLPGRIILGWSRRHKEMEWRMQKDRCQR